MAFHIRLDRDKSPTFKCRITSYNVCYTKLLRVSAPGGTDIEIGLKGRTAKSDDGDFSRPGTGGNLPAGETFVSPENGTANGTIA